MINILLIISFIKIEAKDIIKDKGLEKLWLDSQVLIYHNSNPNDDVSLKGPDCFGNLLTKKFVITAASCFMNTESILKYSETKNTIPTEAEEKQIISSSIKVNIENTHIAKVNITYYSCGPISIYSWSISHILEHEFFCLGCLGSSGSKTKEWI